MEDPNTNPAMLPNLNNSPDANFTPNPTPTPIPSPAAVPSSGAKPRTSKLGLYSLISGLLTAGGGIVAVESPLMANGSDTTLRITYGVLCFVPLVFMLVLSLPSFKKNPYPNLAGMVGLFLNLTVFYQSLSALVAILAIGH
jgi:hypothetical protein